MTLPGNGTTKRIIASVAAAIIIGLATQVYINTNRVTAVEVEIKAIKEGIVASRVETLANRVENREEHRIITVKLDEIAKDVRK